jgi:DNA/RNA-binding domain of Phe-tRNA-synthetase-like protein
VTGGEPDLGRVAPELAAEFPDLRLWHTEVRTPAPKSPPEVRERLRALSDRFRGGDAIVLRNRPVPHAHRVFHRHIGLDPDVHRVPVEAVVVERLTAGGFTSVSLLDDALTIAVMETGVGVWALDAGTVTPPFELRGAREHERLGRRDERAPWLPGGRLCVADAEGAVAVLFGDVAPGHGVTPATRSAHLFAVQVPGVPDVHVSEALWTVTDTLESAAS